MNNSENNVNFRNIILRGIVESTDETEESCNDMVNALFRSTLKLEEHTYMIYLLDLLLLGCI